MGKTGWMFMLAVTGKENVNQSETEAMKATYFTTKERQMGKTNNVLLMLFFIPVTFLIFVVGLFCINSSYPCFK